MGPGTVSGMTDCGGCQGLGSHRRHCPRSPTYNRWLELADQAEDLGDRIGSNDMGAANMAYGLAGRLRERGRERRRARQAVEETDRLDFRPPAVLDSDWHRHRDV